MGGSHDISYPFSKEKNQGEDGENDEDDGEGPSTSHKPDTVAEESRLADRTEDENAENEDEQQPPRKKSKKSKNSDSKTSENDTQDNDNANKKMGSKKRKAKWKGKQKMSSYPKEEQSSRGMSFKRMEAYGMHSEVKRVKKLRARDKRR